jgi:hypothetical protein
MKKLLYEAGREALKAFVITFLTFVTGLLAATNLDEFQAIGVAGLVASGVAALKALKVFAPKLSFASLVRQPFASWLDAFTIAGLSSFLVLIDGLSNAPNYETTKAVFVAAVVGGLQAGFRAVEGLFTKSETPLPSFGTDNS